MTLGEKIRTLRKHKNLTQKQLADLCHMERRTLWGYENDKNVPSDIKVYRSLSEVLECDINYLIGQENKSEEKIDYWAVRNNFLELLINLDHASAMSLLSDVVSAYSSLLAGVKDSSANDPDHKKEN